MRPQRTLVGLWMSLAVACGVEPEPFVDPPEAWGTGVGGQVDQAAPPVSLQTSTALPGQSLTLTLSVTGAVPGERVWFVRGASIGAGACPVPGVCLDVVGHVLLGDRVADGAGVAELTVALPTGVPVGGSAAMQAVAATGTGFALAPAVTVTIGHPDDPCDPTGGGTWPAASASLECEVMALINQARATGWDCGSTGMFAPTHPVSLHPSHIEAARVHTDWMASSGTLSHDSPGGPMGDTFSERLVNAGYTPWTRLFENIGRGQSTATGAVADWLGSPPHCRNLLRDNVRHVGVGHAVSASGQTYWTVSLGEP